MPLSQPVPLGLSDLTQDECLIVSISRAWLRLGPTYAVAEHSIARLLQTDRIYPALDALFDTFRSLTPNRPAELPAESDLLSPQEERLLDRLALAPFTPENPDEPLSREEINCRAALWLAEIELRPPDAIERSGRDQRMHRIAQSYQSLLHL
ncbi:MAG: hypothetical protein AAGD01_11285 [Acidobacteriota bacterium]